MVVERLVTANNGFLSSTCLCWSWVATFQVGVSVSGLSDCGEREGYGGDRSFSDRGSRSGLVVVALVVIVEAGLS